MYEESQKIGIVKVGMATAEVMAVIERASRESSAFVGIETPEGEKRFVVVLRDKDRFEVFFADAIGGAPSEVLKGDSASLALDLQGICLGHRPSIRSLVHLPPGDVVFSSGALFLCILPTPRILSKIDFIG